MNKKMIALLAGALMALTAGTASANFGNGQLNFYAYGNVAGTSEVGVNLGSITSLLSGPGATITKGASAVSGLLSGSTTIYAGLYGYDATTGNVYVAANEGLGTFAAVGSSYTAFKTQNTAVNTAYGTTTDLKTITSKGTSATASYFGKMDKGVNGGSTYSSFVPAGLGADFSTTLTADITKSIYMFDAATGNFSDTGTTAIFKTDGSVTVANTPIPPAFFLMGSGLLGMIGLRRKKA